MCHHFLMGDDCNTLKKIYPEDIKHLLGTVEFYKTNLFFIGYLFKNICILNRNF